MRARTFWSCIFIGVIVGTAMIYLHIGPGVFPAPPAYTASYRNQLRQQYVDQLTSALKQYYGENGSFPITIPSSSTQICTTAGQNCTSMHLVDLSFLTTAGNYIIGIPHDPNGGHGKWGSGFYISKLSGGDIQVTAPEAEQGKHITSTIKP